MKYLFFLTGLVLFVAGVGLAVSGAQSDWDARIAIAPCFAGALLIIAGVAFHAVDEDGR